MAKKATISVIVPAAGCGARANLNGNKVLALLAGQPLLQWTLNALTAPGSLPPAAHLLELWIAARPDEWDLIRPLDSSSLVSLRLIEGGASRQQSVANAARAAQGDFLLVHDAARPLVSPDLISRVCAAALQTGAAISAMPVSDTVKSCVEQSGATVISQTLDRQSIWLAQTPQIFARPLFLQALDHAAATGFAGTDCASLVEQIGHPVRLVPGEARNFKVTYAADLDRAAALLESVERL